MSDFFILESANKLMKGGCMAGNNSKRGLAKADEDTRERVASMGGQSQSTEEKRKAGRKGGQNSRRS
jgi:hypothetical protein